MMKVLATDLDGTLIFEGGVGGPDAAAVQSWKDAGNTFVIDTGRSLEAVAAARRDSGVPRPDYVIAFTGAVIADADLDVIESTPIGHGLLSQIADLLRGEPALLMASTIGHDYTVLAPPMDRPDGRPFEVAPWARPGSLDELDDADLFGIPIAIPDEEVRRRLEPQLLRLCEGRAEVHRNLFFIDVVPLGTTKGSGLRRLLDGFLPGHGEVYAIGDSWNDLPMHEVADHFATLPHAPADVREQCDLLVGSVAGLIGRALG